MAPDKLLLCRRLRFYLRLSCVWPDESEEHKIGKKFYIKCCSIFLGTLFFDCCFFRHNKIIIDAGLSLTEDFCIGATMSEIYVVLVLYLKSRKKILKVLIKVSNFENFGEPEGWHKCLKKLDFYSDTIFIYMNITVTLHNVIKLMEVPACRARQIQENCGFILTSSTPKIIDFRTNPAIYVTYLVIEHCLVQQYVAIPLWACLQVFELCQAMVFKLTHLKSMLEKCFEGDDPVKMRQDFNRCVQFHNTIIGDTTAINECFRVFMLINWGAKTIVIAAILNVVIEGVRGFFSFAFAYIMILFISCLGGQRLIDASLKLSDDVYTTNWHKADLSIQKDLILMLKKSQRPLLIWAGKFTFLSFPLFVSMMKASYSFITLLNSGRK